MLLIMPLRKSAQMDSIVKGHSYQWLPVMVLVGFLLLREPDFVPCCRSFCQYRYFFYFYG